MKDVTYSSVVGNSTKAESSEQSNERVAELEEQLKSLKTQQTNMEKTLKKIATAAATEAVSGVNKTIAENKDEADKNFLAVERKIEKPTTTTKKRIKKSHKNCLS